MRVARVAWRVCVLALAWTAAVAAKPVPRIDPVPVSVPRVVGSSGSQATMDVCDTGPRGPLAYVVGYILPPHDVYYTHIHCDACAPESSYVGAVHVLLRFPVACVQPVAISFVAAMGDSDCLEPDTTHVVYEPWATPLTAAQPGDYDFILILPRAASISGDMFLAVDFTADGGAECASPDTRPLLVTNETCIGCGSWNDSVDGRQNLCQVGFPGQPVMFALLDVCVTSVRHASWGTLKQLYR